jgi:hypothetical protein
VQNKVPVDVEQNIVIIIVNRSRSSNRVSIALLMEEEMECNLDGI